MNTSLQLKPIVHIALIVTVLEEKTLTTSWTETIERIIPAIAPFLFRLDRSLIRKPTGFIEILILLKTLDTVGHRLLRNRCRKFCDRDLVKHAGRISTIVRILFRVQFHRRDRRGTWV